MNKRILTRGEIEFLQERIKGFQVPDDEPVGWEGSERRPGFDCNTLDEVNPVSHWYCQRHSIDSKRVAAPSVPHSANTKRIPAMRARLAIGQPDPGAIGFHDAVAKSIERNSTPWCLDRHHRDRRCQHQPGGAGVRPVRTGPPSREPPGSSTGPHHYAAGCAAAVECTSGTRPSSPQPPPCPTPAGFSLILFFAADESDPSGLHPTGAIPAVGKSPERPAGFFSSPDRSSANRRLRYPIERRHQCTHAHSQPSERNGLTGDWFRWRVEF
jgi:hypothetical protein